MRLGHYYIELTVVERKVSNKFNEQSLYRTRKSNKGQSSQAYNLCKGMIHKTIKHGLAMIKANTNIDTDTNTNTNTNTNTDIRC